MKKVGNAWDFAGGRALAAANTFKTAQQAQQADINAQRASDAQTAGSRIRGGPQFAAFGKLDPAAANQIEGAIRRIQKAIEEGKVSLTNFEKIYMALLNDPKANLGNLTAGEEKVAAALEPLAANLRILVIVQKHLPRNCSSVSMALFVLSKSKSFVVYSEDL